VDIGTKALLLEFRIAPRQNNINSLRFDSGYEIVNYLYGFSPEARRAPNPNVQVRVRSFSVN
jgi:hypothetical protein